MSAPPAPRACRERRVLVRHALRTSLISFVSLFGLDFGALVGGGALLTEVVFGLQGVGRLTYDALLNLDLPMIMATVMYAAFFVVLANALVDLLYILARSAGAACLSHRCSRSPISASPSAPRPARCARSTASRSPSATREIVSIVGESGSGKTVTVMSVLGLLGDVNVMVTGSIRFRGRELVGLPQRELRAIRGGDIAMIFQDPMTALTPVYTDRLADRGAAPHPSAPVTACRPRRGRSSS